MINLGELLVDKKSVSGFRISAGNLYVILNNGREYHLGYYRNEEEAVEARNKILIGLVDEDGPRTPDLPRKPNPFSPPFLSVVA